MEQALPTLQGEARARPSHEAGERLHTIGEVARAYGVTLRALRFYEDRGLIRPARYGVSRFYDAAARARLETILRGKRLGFTLTQIQAMLPDEEKPACAERLDLQETQVVAQIAQLERKRDELDGAIAALRDAHLQMARGAASDIDAA